MPGSSGVYVFTLHPGPLDKGGVIYIGKAKSVRKRLSSYLVNPSTMPLFSLKSKGKLSSSLRHTGKNLLLMEIQQKSRYGPSGVYIRWIEMENPAAMEKELIIKYKPRFNTMMNPDRNHKS